MSFYRAPFRSFVTNQLIQRVKLLEEGMRFFKVRGVGDRSFEVPDYRTNNWYQQYLTKRAFLRVAPLVRIEKGNSITGTNYTKNWVLEGVPLNKVSSTFEKYPQFPSNLAKTGNKNFLLNNPTIRTNPDTDGFGIVPPPGVDKFEIHTKSFYGNLREASYSIKCFSIKQFEIIEKLYARPGHHVLLEWGWDHYISNNQLKKVTSLVSDLGNDFFWGDSVEAGPIYRAIEDKKINNKGCYDGFLGIIKNFSTNVDQDGTYNINVQLIGRGDIIDSLILNRDGDLSISQLSPTGTWFNSNFFSSINSGIGLANRADRSAGFVGRYDIEATSEGRVSGSTEFKTEDDEEVNTTNLNYMIKYAIHQSMLHANGLQIETFDTQDSDLSEFNSDLKEFEIQPFTDTFCLYDPLTYYNINPSDDVNPKIPPTSTYDKDLIDVYYIPSSASVDSGDFGVVSDVSDPAIVGRWGEHQVEYGLGPYIRLGYLIKVLNGLCIPHDGKGKPLTTINNMLYVGKWQGEREGDLERMYLSCYNPLIYNNKHSSISTINNNFKPKTPIKKLFELYNSFPTEVKSKIERGINEYISSTLLPNYESSDVSGGSGENYIEPIFTGEINKYGPIFISPTKTYNGDKEYGAGDLAPNSKGDIVKDIEAYYSGPLGSCMPSEVLFPHQFAKQMEGNSVNINNYRATNYMCPIITVPRKSPLEQHYSDKIAGPYQGTRSKPSEPEIYQFWRYLDDTLLKKEYNSYRANLPYGLCAHAFRDSLQLLHEQEKISKKLYDKGIKYFTNSGEPKSKTIEYFKNLFENTNTNFIPDNTIDNIYLNSFFLNDLVEKNPDITLDKFLNTICKSINKASGNQTDIKVVTNPVFNDMISLVDFKVNSVKLSKEKQFVFPKTGYTSLFKKLTLGGKIPSAMASTIAIASQGSRTEGNLDQVTYKAFISDVQDRIAANPPSNSTANKRIQQSNLNEVDKYINKFINAMKGILQYNRLYATIYQDIPHRDKEWFSTMEKDAKNGIKTLVKNLPYLTSNIPNSDGTVIIPRDPDKTSLAVSSIIPLNISITMEGISGILASNTFKLGKGILPPKYNADRVSYMVSKEKQTVKGGTWETTLNGYMVLDDTDETPATKIPTPKRTQVSASVYIPEVVEELGNVNVYDLVMNGGAIIPEYKNPIIGDWQPLNYIINEVRPSDSLPGDSVLGTTQAGNWNKDQIKYYLDNKLSGVPDASISYTTYIKGSGIADLQVPEYIVLHSTAGWSSAGYEELKGITPGTSNKANSAVVGQGLVVSSSSPLIYKERNASFHFCVDDNGNIAQGARMMDRTWHAGSNWDTSKADTPYQNSSDFKNRVKDKINNGKNPQYTWNLATAVDGSGPYDTMLSEVRKQEKGTSNPYPEDEIRRRLELGALATGYTSIGIETAGDRKGWDEPSESPIEKKSGGNPYPKDGIGVRGGGLPAKMYWENNYQLLSTLADLVSSIIIRYSWEDDWVNRIIGHDWRCPWRRSDPGTWQDAFPWEDFTDPSSGEVIDGFYTRVAKRVGWSDSNLTPPLPPITKEERLYIIIGGENTNTVDKNIVNTEFSSQASTEGVTNKYNAEWFLGGVPDYIKNNWTIKTFDYKENPVKRSALGRNIPDQAREIIQYILDQKQKGLCRRLFITGFLDGGLTLDRILNSGVNFGVEDFQVGFIDPSLEIEDPIDWRGALPSKTLFYYGSDKQKSLYQDKWNVLNSVIQGDDKKETRFETLTLDEYPVRFFEELVPNEFEEEPTTPNSEVSGPTPINFTFTPFTSTELPNFSQEEISKLNFYFNEEITVGDLGGFFDPNKQGQPDPNSPGNTIGFEVEDNNGNFIRYQTLDEYRAEELKYFKSTTFDNIIFQGDFLENLPDPF